MAVKQITRFEATDGRLFTEERAATKYQDSLNNRDRSTFRRKTFDDFINEMIAEGTEEQQKLYTRLVKGDIGYDESQSFFETIWLGQITNTKTNQRLEYSKMLTTIIGNDETHLKADGVYSFSINGGPKTEMTKKSNAPGETPIDLNVSVLGGGSYRLSTVNGKDGSRTFTLTRTDKGGQLATGLTFNNNVLSARETADGTISITWASSARKG
jgi:hypothetical protein